MPCAPTNTTNIFCYKTNLYLTFSTPWLVKPGSPTEFPIDFLLVPSRWESTDALQSPSTYHSTGSPFWMERETSFKNLASKASGEAAWERWFAPGLLWLIDSCSSLILWTFLQRLLELRDIQWCPDLPGGSSSILSAPLLSLCLAC